MFGYTLHTEYILHNNNNILNQMNMHLLMILLSHSIMCYQDIDSLLTCMLINKLTELYIFLIILDNNNDLYYIDV
jgi:hypothetical protein